MISALRQLTGHRKLTEGFDLIPRYGVMSDNLSQY